MTSFTLTDIARMPGGIADDSPAPPLRAASLLSTTGSFSTTDESRPRFTTSSTLENPPATMLLAGHGTTFRSAAASRTPVGSGPRRHDDEGARDFDLAHGHALEGQIHSKARQRGRQHGDADDDNMTDHDDPWFSLSTLSCITARTRRPALRFAFPPSP